MKTTLGKEQMKKIRGGDFDDYDVFDKTVKCTRGPVGATYDTCCNSEQDISGQVCCQRKHGPGSVFLQVVSGRGNCVDSPVSDLV